MSDSRLAVVVLAAGAGTRMRSKKAKVLHPIAGVPMIGHVLATARELDPAHVLTVVRHQRDAVAAAIAELSPDAIVVDQDEVPGTGRAVEQAVAALPADFEGDVVVVSGDVPLLDAATLAGLVAAHRGAGAEATLLSAVLDDATGYGRIVRDADGGVDRIVEHKDASDAERAIAEINSGSYVFSAAALRTHLPTLTTENAAGEKYLTEVVGLLRAAGQPIAAVPVAEPWIVGGVNDRAQLAEQARRLNAMIVRGWQLAGVTITDPATTWIDLAVTIGEDTEILPGSRLLGATTIDRDAVIGPDTTLIDTEVGEGASVVRSQAELAVFKAFSTVGPFSYIRPNTELGGGGKIGAFVETKNAQIGRGTKVPHLSYVGDTEVGEESNLGAGTITSNYDGVNKHRTTIGRNVRIASHTVLVAPVRIGDGAYTGAGAVVRKDVPAGSLALTVAPQRNIEGWVEQKRPGSASAQAAAESDGQTPDEPTA
ncbi:bifunctional UDP-N-acetylglucosamine diphosphorylase/glucosamine-1-phosphate N-acetyltransferase GlmU [Schumannella luteola]|uniref:Bifunctional protein GlmU n=1 Tax=Schumannella luteola TaxID=472059 RepID=A0A852YDF6_9MICO|nr:bifunctional UDP-N-acetylglucosamine diphosphorylase/glucosamine-1-phosphate N-acetyltransferase GlmU [Schumannella luteola]NYG99340.1 bifunctional UDP-N-acetylglucosamine pyrophosphorylase/glucosamine-1-phosphate N-acetyltransferase [Schumannella luteola]TPX06070.1 bifunctional UDP-N-acetylglucosamine diphosphorylase/glucosamine-1-phosphate N-acetyltransferase GlmU [Schumannella luteola]